jgi:hypothetical protein
MRGVSADIAAAWTRANAIHTATYALLVHEYLGNVTFENGSKVTLW